MGEFGLMLSGGGARGAYQAGALQGLAEVLQNSKDTPDAIKENPFLWMAGISAGAINTTFCASRPGSFIKTADDLTRLWSQLKTKQIYRGDWWNTSKVGLSWVKDFSLSPFKKSRSAKELLNVGPLIDVLEREIDFPQIAKNINQGRLKGVAVTAFNYTGRSSTTFLQASNEIKPWERIRREAIPTILTARHLLASSSIPLLFSPVTIGNSVFGDGTIRNTAPLSPMVHMGCSKFIFIGVRHENKIKSKKFNPRYLGQRPEKPSVGKIAGNLLNGLFFDNLEIDINRMNQINGIAKAYPKMKATGRRSIRTMEMLTLNPSEDLAELASGNLENGLPSAVRYVIKSMGSEKDPGDLASYLMFEESFTKKLVTLGRDDSLAAKDKILEFFLNDL